MIFGKRSVCSFLCVLSALLFAAGQISTCMAVDYSAWQYQKNIYLNTASNGAQVTSTVTKFPVLVRLTSSNFTFSQATTTGSDLRFSKSDNSTALPYQIESFDRTAQVAAIWVLVDTVYGNNGSQYFILHWGNTTATSESNLNNAVFDTTNGFYGVWHMSDTTDATKNINKATRGTGTAAPTINTSGIIASSYTFDGTNDYLTIANSPTLDMNSNFTTSLWILHDVSAAHGWERMLTRKSAYDDPTGWEACFVDQAYPHACSTGVSMMLSGGYYNPDDVVTSWLDGNWRLFTVVFKNDSMFIYGDGALKTSTYMHTTRTFATGYACTDSMWIDPDWIYFNCDTTYQTVFTDTTFKPIDNDLPIKIGGTQNVDPTAFYKGKLDEIRLEKRVRSGDWIKLCYENQKPSQTLVSVGSAPVTNICYGQKYGLNALHQKLMGRLHVLVYDVKGRTVADKMVDVSHYSGTIESLIAMMSRGVESKRMNTGACFVQIFNIDKAKNSRLVFSDKILLQR